VEHAEIQVEVMYKLRQERLTVFKQVKMNIEVKFLQRMVLVIKTLLFHEKLRLSESHATAVTRSKEKLRKFFPFWEDINVI
jgi:hypothetical protein